MVDAGTSGWKNFPEFKERVIDRSCTRVLALVNSVGSGMGTKKEDDPSEMDAEAALRVRPKQIRTLLSASSPRTTRGLGYVNEQRNIRTLLGDNLRAGDIYTHCYSGHRQEVLENGKVNPAMDAGRKRGIFFDVGHGAGSSRTPA